LFYPTYDTRKILENKDAVMLILNLKRFGGFPSGPLLRKAPIRQVVKLPIRGNHAAHFTLWREQGSGFY